MYGTAFKDVTLEQKVSKSESVRVARFYTAGDLHSRT